MEFLIIAMVLIAIPMAIGYYCGWQDKSCRKYEYEAVKRMNESYEFEIARLTEYVENLEDENKELCDKLIKYGDLLYGKCK